MKRSNMQIQLALIFFSVMVVASVFSFSITTLILHRSMLNQQRGMQRQIVENLTALLEKTDLPEEDCMRIVSTESQKVSRAEGELARKAEQELKNGEMKVVNHLIGYRTLFNIDGTIYQILSASARGGQNSFYFLFAGMISSLFFCMLIGTFMTGMLTSRFLRPIRALNKATEAVAQGDFSIQVPVTDEGEMGRLTEKFNKMTRELGSIETLRNDFVSNVSHELKTPLAAISGYAHLLQTEELTPEERKEYIDIIAGEADRLSRMTSNMLRLSRLENQQLLTFDHYDLDEQLRRSILMLEGQWSAKGLEMEVDLPHTPFTGSQELLQQVWINLIGNAVKFTPEGGKITVSLEKRAGEVAVTVADTGIGMDGETCSHIFEKFYQGDRARASEGNGLGLALVKRIVDLSGGTVAVTSAPGKGSAFTVTLPDGKT